MPAVKVIKVLGISEESWEEAAKEAFGKASETVEDISGIEVESWTANVEDGKSRSTTRRWRWRSRFTGWSR